MTKKWLRTLRSKININKIYNPALDVLQMTTLFSLTHHSVYKLRNTDKDFNAEIFTVRTKIMLLKGDTSFAVKCTFTEKLMNKLKTSNILVIESYKIKIHW